MYHTYDMMTPVRVRSHPKIVSWPPQPGGTHVTVESPQAESQPILKEVHNPVRAVLRLSCEFKGHVWQYSVVTRGPAFAKKLAVEFSKHVGYSLEQLGNLDVGF